MLRLWSYSSLDHLPGAGWTPVKVDLPKCLRQGRPYAACNVCAEACPASAITATDEGVSIAGGCLGCGACAEACPTGAVRASGFAPPETATPARLIECSRVPPDRITADTWTVPCLAGLSAGAVAAHLAGTGVRSLTLLDRGWCSACPASAGRELATLTRERLQAALDRAAPGRITVAVKRAFLPASHAAPAGAPRPLTRRDLLRSLFVRPGAAALPSGMRNDRLALAELAAAAGEERPTLFPRLALSERCRDHSMCAAGCPTGALTRKETDDGRTVRVIFYPRHCIACGRCERLCPEQALTLSAWDSPDHSPVELRQRRMAVCATCEDTFAAAEDGETVCEVCRKETALFADLQAPRRGASLQEARMELD